MAGIKTDSFSSSDLDSAISEITEGDLVTVRTESEDEPTPIIIPNNDSSDSSDSDSNSDNDKNKRKSQEFKNALGESDAVSKLKALLAALALKEKEVKEKEAEHLHKAQGLLSEMDKTAAFVEFKNSKACKEQIAKLKSAYDAANKQLSLLTKQQNGNGKDDSSSSSSSDSDDAKPSAKKLDDTPEDTSEEEHVVERASAASATLSRIFIDADEVKLLAALADEPNHHKPNHHLTGSTLLENEHSHPHHNHNHSHNHTHNNNNHHHPLPRGDASSVGTAASKGIDMRNVDELFKRAAPPKDEIFVPKERRRKPPSKKHSHHQHHQHHDNDAISDDDSDVDLENYIRRWRRNRDEDVLGVLKALRKENKLLKKKLKQDRLRIGIELRRVSAANKVLEDQNRSMQELLLRAKIEIQSVRAPPTTSSSSSLAKPKKEGSTIGLK